MMIKAKYQRRSGLRDYDIPVQQVTIVGFVSGEYEPGYQSHGTKRCTIAIIADETGRLSQVELTDLTVEISPCTTDTSKTTYQHSDLASQQRRSPT